MKNAIYLLIPFTMITCGGEEQIADADNVPENAEEITKTTSDHLEVDSNRKSPRTRFEETVNNVRVSMDYGSPRMRDRVLWGDLVPYDKVWRAGADEVTAITFDKEVMFAENSVSAGTYGLFIIPKENTDWIVILNEEWSHEDHNVWGAYDYKEEKDVLRIDINPEWNEESIEELTFGYNGNAQLTFSWGKARLTISLRPVET